MALVAVAAAMLMAVAGLPALSIADQSVTFPAAPYEGLQLTFTVAGAELGPGEEMENIPGATWGPGVIYRNGKYTGGPITVTGTATGAAGAYGYLEASLTGSTTRITFNAPEGAWSKDFKLTVDDPGSYSSVGLTITIQRFSKYDAIRVAATLNNPNPVTTSTEPTPSTSLTPSGSPTPAGKRPCNEAVRAYDLDPTAGIGTTFDYDDIQRQFEKAISDYERDAKSTAFAQDNILGTLPALAWLGNQGGATSVVNKQFVFTTDADREKWKVRLPKPKEVSPGTERALYEAIYAFSKKEQRKLTPGDVLYLALQQRNGNVKDAMLLAHNTLRSLSRMEQTMGNTDFEWTLVEHNPAFIGDYLEPLVDPAPLGEGQNTGSWYHMFGTAYFEMQARGTWGAYTLVQMSGDATSDQVTELTQQMLQILRKDPKLQVPANQTLYSKLANQVEQVARKYIFGSPDDPAKYCYNVVGAKIGAWLYQKRLLIKPAIQAPPVPPSGATIPTFPFGPLPLGNRPRGWDPAKVDPDTIISSSPLNITWSDGRETMILDQASQSLYGYFPVSVLPQWEADDETWGIVWTNTGSDSYRLTLEAADSGWAHLTRQHGSRTLVYPIELTAGEKLTLTIDPTSPTEPIKRADGSAIVPVETLPAETEPEPDRDQGLWPPLILAAIGLVSLLVTVGVVVLLVVLSRRGRRPPTMRPPHMGPPNMGPPTTRH